MLAARILERDLPAAQQALPVRALVRVWTMDDWPDLAAATGAPDLERGKQMFVAGRCSQCHRHGILGTLVGPDLTSVGRRFLRRDLLRSIVEPSAALDDKYRQTVVVTDDGRTITGMPLEENSDTLVLAVDPLGVQTATIAKSAIVDRRLSPVSPMPTGLADTLTRDELLDLLAWLETE